MVANTNLEVPSFFRKTLNFSKDSRNMMEIDVFCGYMEIDTLIIRNTEKYIIAGQLDPFFKSSVSNWSKSKLQIMTFNVTNRKCLQICT